MDAAWIYLPGCHSQCRSGLDQTRRRGAYMRTRPVDAASPQRVREVRHDGLSSTEKAAELHRKRLLNCLEKGLWLTSPQRRGNYRAIQDLCSMRKLRGAEPAKNLHSADWSVIIISYKKEPIIFKKRYIYIYINSILNFCQFQIILIFCIFPFGRAGL